MRCQCSPGRYCADLLKQSHLVEGLPAAAVGAGADTGTYGLVLEERPAQVLVIIEDPALASRLMAEERPGTAVLRYVSRMLYGEIWQESLIDHHPCDSIPHARLGWLRGAGRWGTAAEELPTAILTIPSQVARDSLRKAAEAPQAPSNRRTPSPPPPGAR